MHIHWKHADVVSMGFWHTGILGAWACFLRWECQSVDTVWCKCCLQPIELEWEYDVELCYCYQHEVLCWWEVFWFAPEAGKMSVPHGLLLDSLAAGFVCIYLWRPFYQKSGWSTDQCNQNVPHLSCWLWNCVNWCWFRNHSFATALEGNSDF